MTQETLVDGKVKGILEIEMGKDIHQETVPDLTLMITSLISMPQVPDEEILLKVTQRFGHGVILGRESQDVMITHQTQTIMDDRK